MSNDGPEQLLHLVIGGRVKDPQGHEFENLDQVDMVGMFPDYTSAEAAWRAASHRSVDDAMTRYFVVHVHKLMDPDHEH